MDEPNAKVRAGELIGRRDYSLGELYIQEEPQLVPRLVLELLPGGVHIVSEPGDHTRPKRSVGPSDPDEIGKVVAKWMAGAYEKLRVTVPR